MIVKYLYWLRNTLVFAVLAICGSGIAYVKLDQTLNYEPVEATVLGYTKYCRPTSSDQDTQAAFDASSEYAHGKLGSCDGLAQFGLDENAFQMSGRSIALNVWRVWRTNVRYISPADGQMHESTVELGPKDGETVAIGKTLMLRANKHDWRLLQES